LINDLIELAQIEEDPSKLDLNSLDMEGIIREARVVAAVYLI
jgi:hypothetical protein